MIYGYIRVSSDKQTVENQRFEINNFCSRESMTIDGWIEETISGTKSYNKRQLGTLLKRVQEESERTFLSKYRASAAWTYPPWHCLFQAEKRRLSVESVSRRMAPESMRGINWLLTPLRPTLILTENAYI